MHDRTLRFASLFLALSAITLVACDEEPTAPELVYTWRLESWYGHTPPLPLFHGEDPEQPGVVCAHVLVSSIIELRTGRHLDMIDERTRACGDEEPEPYTETRRGTWTMEGDSLFLDIETDHPLLPHAPLDGEIVDHRLRFEFEVFSEAGGVDTVAIVYERGLIPFGT